jgi:hypothetical protein
MRATDFSKTTPKSAAWRLPTNEIASKARSYRIGLNLSFEEFQLAFFAVPFDGVGWRIFLFGDHRPVQG